MGADTVTREFLTAYDYGMGGAWTFIRAASKEDIASKFPQLKIFDKLPEWMTEQHEAYKIAKTYAFDIDEGRAPAWFKDMK